MPLSNIILQLAEGPANSSLFNPKELNILMSNGLVMKENGIVWLTERGESALEYLREVREETTLDKEEELILTALEKYEERLINVGMYDRLNTTVEELANYLSESKERIAKILSNLAKKGYVLCIKKNEKFYYRSRIAEIVRLIAHLRQRFEDQSIEEAPSLVDNVKLRVVDRYVAKRDIPLANVLSNVRYFLEKYYPEVKEKVPAIIDAVKNVMEKHEIVRLSGFQCRSTVKIISDIYELDKKPGVNKRIRVLIAETGAGKTEAYLIPLLIRLTIGKITNKKVGVIIVYPRVELIRNQAMRFTAYLYEFNNKLPEDVPKVKLGLDMGEIPRNMDVLRGPYYKEYKDCWSLTGDTANYNKIKCPILMECTSNGEKIKYRCCREIEVTKEGIVRCKGDRNKHVLPLNLFKEHTWDSNRNDIVLTNPDTLLRRLIEEGFREFLKLHDVIVLVLDEVHLHSGIPGAHMAHIIRRITKIVEKIGKKIEVIVLSATIPSPESFVGTLAGCSVRKENIITVEPDELERVSADYYIFIKPKVSDEVLIEHSEEIEKKTRYIKPLSTMIQAVMVTMHNAKKTHLKYRGIGFVDSIDTLMRWFRAQQDAEKRQLHMLRCIDNEVIGKVFKKRDDGVVYLDYNELSKEKVKIGKKEYTLQFLFDEGELWCFMIIDKKLRSSLEIIPLYSKLRTRIGRNIDLVLATSALEVGYDDPHAIIFFQYRVPASPISFVQRKGRVGRSPEDRPIFIIVLPPYSRKDIYTFQNEDYLVNAKYNDLPITNENYFVQRAHIMAVILDYLSVQESLELSYTTKLESVKAEIISKLKEFSSNPGEIIDWVEDVVPIFRNVRLLKNVINYYLDKLRRI